jgi:uncharacterized membrane protein YedE/YeeE
MTTARGYREIPMKLIKAIWILSSVVVLCMTLYGHYTTNSPEATLNGVVMMVVLSMPAGLLVVFLLNISAMIVGNLFLIYLQSNYFTIIAIWSLMFAAGYFQWFVLAARIFKKIRQKKCVRRNSKGKFGEIR